MNYRIISICILSCFLCGQGFAAWPGIPEDKVSAARFFGVDSKLMIGLPEFNATLAHNVRELNTRDALADWLMQRADQEGRDVRLHYANDKFFATLLFSHEEGLIVAQVELHIDASQHRVIVDSSAIRHLKGLFVPFDEAVSAEEIAPFENLPPEFKTQATPEPKPSKPAEVKPEKTK